MFSVQSNCPTASSSGIPRRRSAARFHILMRPEASRTITAALRVLMVVRCTNASELSSSVRWASSWFVASSSALVDCSSSFVVSSSSLVDCSSSFVVCSSSFALCSSSLVVSSSSFELCSSSLIFCSSSSAEWRSSVTFRNSRSRSRRAVVSRTEYNTPTISRAARNGVTSTSICSGRGSALRWTTPVPASTALRPSRTKAVFSTRSSPDIPGSASVVSFFPATSVSLRPQRLAAAAFQSTTVPSGAVATIGTCDDSTTPRWNCSTAPDPARFSSTSRAIDSCSSSETSRSCATAESRRPSLR